MILARAVWRFIGLFSMCHMCENINKNICDVRPPRDPHVVLKAHIYSVSRPEVRESGAIYGLFRRRLKRANWFEECGNGDAYPLYECINNYLFCIVYLYIL